MTNYFRTNSLSSKIFLTFFTLVILLLTTFFLQIIPNQKEEEQKRTKKQIESMITLTNQQLILASLSIKNSGVTRREELKSIMEHEADRIHKLLIEKKDFTKLEKQHLFKSKKIQCNTTLLDKNKNIIFQNTKEDLTDIKDKLKINHSLRYDIDSKYVCPSGLRRFFYTKEIKNTNKLLLLSCDIDKFKTKGSGLEKRIKVDIQKSFSQMNAFHKGKTYLMWVDIKNANDKPLYKKGDDSFFNEKYCLSRISNLEFPITGDLSGKQILNATDEKPIEHILEDKKTTTWIRTININKKEKFLYITSIYEEDFLQYIDSGLLKILPAAIFSLIIAIILALLVFRRLFKSINILKNTAIEVNKGDTKSRSNIKGDDDIALLAKAFDNMLDSLENNIQILDKRVDEKTQELSSSLNEKETLLKEIHHRVKNNLAITINLIKLEKSKINNNDTLNSLTNIQERVFAMELLHRKLYESNDLSSISLKKYIEELSNDLIFTYSKQNNIEIINDIEDINIDIDYALPCGLIITELVTNSFKYAFKEKGKIYISFYTKNKTAFLKVQDTGKGLDKNIDIYNTKSLGLQIISNIIKGQLFGNLNYIYDKGAKFEIDFKIEEK